MPGERNERLYLADMSSAGRVSVTELAVPERYRASLKSNASQSGSSSIESISSHSGDCTTGS